MDHYGAQRAQPTATGGKCTGRDRLKQAKTLRRCDQLPERDEVLGERQ